MFDQFEDKLLTKIIMASRNKQGGNCQTLQFEVTVKIASYLYHAGLTDRGTIAIPITTGIPSDSNFTHLYAIRTVTANSLEQCRIESLSAECAYLELFHPL